MTRATGNDHPRVVAAINNAIDLVEKDEVDAAIQLLTATATEFPMASSVQGYLAWYLSRVGRHAAAVACAQEAVRLSPASERASLVLYHVLWDAGHQEGALDEMRRYLHVRPSEEYAEILRGWAEKSQSD